MATEAAREYLSPGARTVSLQRPTMAASSSSHLNSHSPPPPRLALQHERDAYWASQTGPHFPYSDASDTSDTEDDESAFYSSFNSSPMEDNNENDDQSPLLSKSHSGDDDVSGSQFQGHAQLLVTTANNSSYNIANASVEEEPSAGSPATTTTTTTLTPAPTSLFERSLTGYVFRLLFPKRAQAARSQTQSQRQPQGPFTPILLSNGIPAPPPTTTAQTKALKRELRAAQKTQSQLQAAARKLQAAAAKAAKREARAQRTADRAMDRRYQDSVDNMIAVSREGRGTHVPEAGDLRTESTRATRSLVEASFVRG